VKADGSMWPTVQDAWERKGKIKETATITVTNMDNLVARYECSLQIALEKQQYAITEEV